MSSNPETGDPALPGSGVKRKSGKQSGSSKSKTKKHKKTIVGKDYLPTDRPSPPVLPALNLAVRPDLELKSSTGVKLLKTKTVTPHHQANLNDESAFLYYIYYSSLISFLC
jgi:hypothetical protein